MRRARARELDQCRGAPPRTAAEHDRLVLAARRYLMRQDSGTERHRAALHRYAEAAEDRRRACPDAVPAGILAALAGESASMTADEARAAVAADEAAPAPGCPGCGRVLRCRCGGAGC